MIEIPRLGGGGGVFAADCALADIRLRWRGNATLEISHPAKARVEEPIDDPDRFYLSGRTIASRRSGAHPVTDALGEAIWIDHEV